MALTPDDIKQIKDEMVRVVARIRSRYTFKLIRELDTPVIPSERSECGLPAKPAP